MKLNVGDNVRVVSGTHKDKSGSITKLTEKMATVQFKPGDASRLRFNALEKDTEDTEDTEDTAQANGQIIAGQINPAAGD